MKTLRDFIEDKRGNVVVGVLFIVLIAVTATVWLVTYMPVAMLIDVVRSMTVDPNALRVMNMANVSCAGLLIGEIIALLIWLFASSFKREDQTYSMGAGYN